MRISNKSWIIIGLILLLTIILGIKYYNKSKANSVKLDAGSDSSLILNQSDVVMVAHGNVESVIPFTGDLSPVAKTVISAEVNGEVFKILVKAGQLVKKGQLLAILEDTELQQNVNQAQANVAEAESQFALDKTKLERNYDLYQQGFISKVAYAELNNSYQIALQKIKNQQASLLKYQKQLANTKIKAPFTGYIYQVNIDLGQFVSQGKELFSLANLDMMQITTAVSGEQINLVKEKQVVNFKAGAGSIKYQGYVSRINRVAEVGTKAYMVYIDFNNTVSKLYSGQFVNGGIIVKQLVGVDYIPTAAVRKNANGFYVLAIEKDIVRVKPVKVLLTNTVAEMSAVSGLSLGDKILNGNVLTVKATDKVKVM